MARTLRRALVEEGYAVTLAGDGRRALELARAAPFEAVLLDLGLPGLDGMEVLRELRRGSGIPVLILTARDALPDRVAGLDAGADDYLIKPFALEELLARVRALVRRPGPGRRPLLEYRDLRLDPAAGLVRRGDRPLDCSAREYALLHYFLLHPGEVLSKSRLYHAVWGSDFDGRSNVLEVYVRYLRAKLEAGGEPRLLQTVRGRGYLLGESH